MRQRAFQSIARVITRFPWAVVVGAVCLTFAGVWLAHARLVTNTNQDDLLSERLGHHRRYKEYLREFGDQEYLIAVVHAGDRKAHAIAFIDRLTTRLRTIPDIREVIGQIDTEAFARSALLFLSTDQLRQLSALLATPGFRPEELAQWQGLDQLFAAVNRRLDGPLPGTTQAPLQAGLDFLRETLAAMQQALTSTTTPTSPWARVGTAAAGLSTPLVDHHGFLSAGDGKYLLVLIMPRKDFRTLEVISAPLAAVRQAITDTQREFPGVEVGLTGLPVMASDEMATSNRDMTWATIASFVLVWVLFSVALRRFVQPLLTMLALAMAICWTYGFAAMAIGSLNLLSLVFVMILVGEGIEFGLHLVARYREELALGQTPMAAIHTTVIQTGKSNLTSALTTAIALLGALLTNFQALRELGLIAGVGIICCLISMVVVLPAMLYLCDRHKGVVVNHQPPSGISLRFLGRWYRHPRVLLGIGTAVVIACLPFFWRVHYEHNLLKLQARGLESIRYEHVLTQDTDLSTLQAVFVAPDRDAARALAARVAALPSVGRVESIHDVIPSDQAEKIAVVEQQLGAVGRPVMAPLRGSVHAVQLLASLTELQFRMAGFAEGALRNGDTEAVTTLEELDTQLSALRAGLRTGDPEAMARLDGFQSRFMTEFRRLVQQVFAGLEPQPITEQDLPEIFRQRYVSPAGHYAVYASPKGNAWEPATMAQFVRELRSVDPQVTGVPIEIYEASQLLERSFRFIAGLALILIFGLTWLDFRSLRAATLAVLPLCLGLWVLFGLMGLFGLSVNLANFFAIPIIIGISINNGIHIMHRARENGGFDPAIMWGSAGFGVCLASLTTITGFGMLIFAAHRGLQSLGLVITLGVSASLAAAMLVLPALLQRQRRSRQGTSLKLKIHGEGGL